MLRPSLLKLAIIPSLAIMFCSSALADTRRVPADNDDSYKLPMFVPKVAQPQAGQKVMFEDDSRGNDEIYSLPKRSAVKPMTPAETDKAMKKYAKEYEEYQRQMQQYNEEMVEYKKKLAAQQQQATQSAPPSGDNDASYILPGQYMPALKDAKPRQRTISASPAPSQAPAAAAPTPAQAPAVAPAAAQYNQRYNYSDQSERQDRAKHQSYPSYYY